MKTRRLRVVIPILVLGLAVIGYAGYRGYGYLATRPSLTEGEAIAMVQEKVKEELETALEIARTAGTDSVVGFSALATAQDKAAQLETDWYAAPLGDKWVVLVDYWRPAGFTRESERYLTLWEVYSDSRLIRYGFWNLPRQGDEVYFDKLVREVREKKVLGQSWPP